MVVVVDRSFFFFFFNALKIIAGLINVNTIFLTRSCSRARFLTKNFRYEFSKITITLCGLALSTYTVSRSGFSRGWIKRRNELRNDKLNASQFSRASTVSPSTVTTRRKEGRRPPFLPTRAVIHTRLRYRYTRVCGRAHRILRRR